MLKIMKPFLASAAILAAATSAPAMSAPPKEPTSDTQMSRKVESGQQQVDQMVGYPSIINGFEKRMVRMLYELRDNPDLQTFTYMVTLDGSVIKICNSVGYGINASIQFSNPEKIVENRTFANGGSIYGTLPQMEPNGLAMPEGLAATYVMCQSPENPEEIKPVYLEPDIIVLPYELPGATPIGG